MQLTESLILPFRGVEPKKSIAQQATAYENLYPTLVEAKKAGVATSPALPSGVVADNSLGKFPAANSFSTQICLKQNLPLMRWFALGEEAKLDATVSNLQAIVNDMEAMDTTMYTSDSVAALTDAVNAAKALLAEGANPTQAQLDQAIADIEGSSSGRPSSEYPGRGRTLVRIRIPAILRTLMRPRVLTRTRIQMRLRPGIRLGSGRRTLKDRRQYAACCTDRLLCMCGCCCWRGICEKKRHLR